MSERERARARTHTHTRRRAQRKNVAYGAKFSPSIIPLTSHCFSRPHSFPPFLPRPLSYSLSYSRALLSLPNTRPAMPLLPPLPSANNQQCSFISRMELWLGGRDLEVGREKRSRRRGETDLFVFNEILYLEVEREKRSRSLALSLHIYRVSE